jgi:hypothetical protein
VAFVSSPGRLMRILAMERYELQGVRLYQLDSCAAIGDHDLCPGITSLHAGDCDLGTVACNCPCHKKPESEVPQ